NPAPIATSRRALENPAPAPMEPVVRSPETILEAPKAIALEVPQHAPPPMTAELPVAPKVAVRTGTFNQTVASAETGAGRTVSVGAFGDRNGAHSGGAAGRDGAGVHLGGFGDQSVVDSGNRPARQPE